ncbi:MAG: DUF86 domain-containing protein [Ruminococcus sp.]|jgi:uncharacterized protein with HEPN domain|nr:DUF86 domain-containing protein [Ruminococcus sp.]
MPDKKDAQILSRIVFYCEEAIKCVTEIEGDIDKFKSGQTKYSVSFLIQNIGELTKLLSDSFVDETKEKIPWRQIRVMRNMFAHTYEKMSLDKIFETAVNDIPVLKSFCEKYLKENS